jgi:hypothetical protein
MTISTFYIILLINSFYSSLFLSYSFFQAAPHYIPQEKFSINRYIQKKKKKKKEIENFSFKKLIVFLSLFHC